MMIVLPLTLRHVHYFAMTRVFKIFSLFLFVGIGWSIAEVVSEAPLGSGDVSGNEEPLYMTVPDVIDRVKSQNLELLIQKESVRRALEQSYQQRAALLPQFGLSARQTRSKFSTDFFSGALPSSVIFNSFGARVEGSISLIDSQRFADWKLAKLSYAIQQFDYEVALQDVLDQAILIYFTHLRDLRQVEIFEGNRAREEELLKLAKQQFEAGATVKIDVTRADVRLATVKRDLMEAITNADDSILQLKALLDLDLDLDLLLDRSLVDGIKSPPAL